MTKLSTVATVVGFVVLILFLVFIGTKACSLYDTLSIVEGQNQLLKDQQKELSAKADTQARLNEELQDQMDSQIAEFGSVIASNEQTMEDMGTTIGSLENDLIGLTDKDKIITNLKAQVTLWKDRFSVAQDTIEQQEGIIFSLTKKYNSERTLRITYEGVIEKDEELFKNLDIQINLLEKKVIGTRIKGRVLTFVAVVAGGYLAYEMIKKQIDN